jgi:4a-hydroxytetrahydrobiopterin dehydratase
MKKLNTKEITQKITSITNWTLKNDALEKTVYFKDFKDAMSAMQRIAFEAERLNHHPEWFNVYNKLNIRLRTHDANGITNKDFMLAEIIDDIL